VTIFIVIIVRNLLSQQLDKISIMGELTMIRCWFGHAWTDWFITVQKDDVAKLTYKELLHHPPGKHTRHCRRCAKKQEYISTSNP